MKKALFLLNLLFLVPSAALALQATIEDIDDSIEYFAAPVKYPFKDQVKNQGIKAGPSVPGRYY